MDMPIVYAPPRTKGALVRPAPKPTVSSQKPSKEKAKEKLQALVNAFKGNKRDRNRLLRLAMNNQSRGETSRPLVLNIENGWPDSRESIGATAANGTSRPSLPSRGLAWLLRLFGRDGSHLVLHGED